MTIQSPATIAAVARLLAGAALLSLPLGGSAQERPTRDFYEVPESAYTRPLGDIKPAPCQPAVSRICEGEQPAMFDRIKGGNPMSVSGLGIPLGGIGAGSFMVNQSGTFGPWDFGGSQNDSWEVRSLTQAAFHVREQYGDAPATVRTLATAGPQVTGTAGPVPDRSWAGPLPGWNALKPGEATYSALYPFGWISYRPFQTDISMRFFSPIVPREDRRSSLPVAYFDVRLANHTGRAGNVSVMFTMPNAPPHVGRTPTTIRTGLTSLGFTDAKHGITGVTLGADDAHNTPDALGSEWTVAAKVSKGQTITFTPSWNASGDGRDVYAPFERDGQLTDTAIDDSHSAGAISVSVRLKPGEVVTIPFVLAWDFPQVGFNDNKTVWMRRYTNFYGARETPRNDYVKGSYPFHQSARIATDALADHDAALRAVLGWWSPLAHEPAYPKVLRTMGLNQLSQLVFNNSFWEGGLVTNTVQPTVGIRSGISKPGMHLFSTVDAASGGNVGNSIDVNSYNYVPYNVFFPSLEKDRLRAFAEASNATPKWTDASTDMSKGPFVVQRVFGMCAPDADSFIDVQSKLIYRYFAAWRTSRDDEFLRFVYPAMKKAMACLRREVPAGSHLPTSLSTPPQTPPPGGRPERRPTKIDFAKLGGFNYANTYNAVPTKRQDAYTSQLFLLSLEVLIEASTRLKQDAAYIAELRAALASARQEYEDIYWDPHNGFYLYTPGPAPGEVATLIDTFYAQHVAEQLGLPDLVSPDHYRTQLTTTYDRFMSRRDANGRLLGAPSMLKGREAYEWPYMSLFGPIQEESVNVGSNFFTASIYHAAGRRFGDPILQQRGVAMATAVAKQIWENDENGFAFNAPEMWSRDDSRVYVYPAYERPLAVWDLLNQIKPLELQKRR